MVLDEAHAAHVGAEIVNHARTTGRFVARLEQSKIADLVLDTNGRLVPLVERLHIDGADPGLAALHQDTDQMAADEPTGAGHHHEIIL